MLNVLFVYMVLKLTFHAAQMYNFLYMFKMIHTSVKENLSMMHTLLISFYFAQPPHPLLKLNMGNIN